MHKAHLHKHAPENHIKLQSKQPTFKLRIKSCISRIRNANHSAVLSSFISTGAAWHLRHCEVTLRLRNQQNDTRDCCTTPELLFPSVWLLNNFSIIIFNKHFGIELFTEFFSIIHATSKSVFLSGNNTKWVYMAHFITHRLERMVQIIAKKKIKIQFFYAQMNVCLANSHILSTQFLTLAMIRHLWPFNETRSKDSTANMVMRLQTR